MIHPTFTEFNAILFLIIMRSLLAFSFQELNSIVMGRESECHSLKI